MKSIHGNWDPSFKKKKALCESKKPIYYKSSPDRVSYRNTGRLQWLRLLWYEDVVNISWKMISTFYLLQYREEGRKYPMFSCPSESATKMLYNFLIDSSGKSLFPEELRDLHLCRKENCSPIPTAAWNSIIDAMSSLFLILIPDKILNWRKCTKYIILY